MTLIITRKKHINKVLLFSILFIFSINNVATVFAISLDQKKLYNQNILYYDLETSQNCTDASAGAITPGAGAPDGITFPNLDPTKMADAINQYIDQASPNSKMKGLGTTIVATAKVSNISPFLIIGLAQKESGIADPNYGDGWNVRNANNSFGRTATPSQPHRVGSRLWYFWTSIKASVDSTAPENKNANGGGDIASYIANVYADELSANDLSAFMYKYAPPTENDTEGYIASLKERIAKLVALTGATATSSTPQASSTQTSSQCCLTSSTVNNDSNKAKIWNYLVTTLGFSNIQAAGIMGNIQQESHFNPDATNPRTHAYGIAQWYAGRETKLRNYAASVNKPANDIDMQLDFLASELNGPYKNNVTAPIKNSSNLAEVTRIWLEIYEVPCLPGSSECDIEMNVRLPNAEKILADFGGGSGPVNIGGSGPSCPGSTLAGPVVLKQLSPYLNSPGGSITPKGITLHWWGGNGSGGIEPLVSALRGNTTCGAGGCSVQLGITKEGGVYQMTRNLTDLAYHAKGANTTTIGIEIEGGPADFGATGIQKYPQKFEAVVATVKMLIEKYSIPIDGSAQCGNVSGIHPHKAYNACAGQTKTDIDDVYFNEVINRVR